MNVPYLKKVTAMSVLFARAAVSDRIGPAVWGGDRQPAPTGHRVGRIGPARADEIRIPGAGAAHTHRAQSSCRNAAFDRRGYMRGVVSVTRRALGVVVSAGARLWHVEGVPAAIQRRARAASDVRVPSYLGNRSPGQSSRGLGPRYGLRGRARGLPPML